MSRLMMEVEIYVEDTGRFRALTVDSDYVYVVIYLDRWQSYEVADKLEAVADGKRKEAYVMEEGLDSLTIEEGEWMKVRITLNGVCGILDRQGVREIAHDLRYGWEGAE